MSSSTGFPSPRPNGWSKSGVSAPISGDDEASSAVNQDSVDTALTGLSFEEAWPGRVRQVLGGVPVDFIGRESFVRTKRAAGRAKDLGGIEGME